MLCLPKFVSFIYCQKFKEHIPERSHWVGLLEWQRTAPWTFG